MRYNIPGNTEQLLLSGPHTVGCSIVFLTPSSICLHCIRRRDAFFSLPLCLSRVVPQTERTLQSRGKKFHEIYAIGKCKLCAQKVDRSSKATLAKNVAMPIDLSTTIVDAAKTIINFSYFKNTNYHACKKLTSPLYICKRYSIRYLKNYQAIF